MKIFEFIGLSIYLVLIAILIVRQVNVSRNFRNNKILRYNKRNLYNYYRANVRYF